MQCKSPTVPLISIGVPLYNAEKYISEALDCLLGQTYSEIEILISDNCSTDRTLEIVEEFASRDKRIKIYRQTENIGPVPNFQFVLEKAKGEYFLWRSYDDWSDATYLEKLSGVLNTNPGADLAVASLIQDNGGRQRAAGRQITSKELGRGVLSRARLLNISHPYWMYGLFRRKAASEAINRVVQQYPHVWAWDHLVLFPIVLSGRVLANYETNFYQRETGISNSRYRPKTAREQVRLALDFYAVCRSVLKLQKNGFLFALIMPFYFAKHTSNKTEKFSRILRVWFGIKKI